MPRYRLIPTGVPTNSDLKHTLSEMGVRNVEVHPHPVPLDDWIGRPTDVMADVIVRRKDLGASSDDMGFVRGEDGTWDALVSEIHLFRFDKKWFAELAQRSGVAVPTAGPRQFAASITSPVTATPASLVAAAKAAELARDEAAAQHARLAVNEVLDDARKSQSIGPWGCLVFFVPLVLWFGASALGARVPVGPMLGLWGFWTFAWFIVVIVVVALRFQKFVSEFGRRFPKDSRARASATAHLRAVAEDKTHKATGLAARLLKQVDAQAAALKQRPVKPRGPGASGP